MGRRQRIRTRKKKSVSSVIHLDHDPVIVKLKQWMSKYNWQNISNIRVSLFSTTGRGVTSLKSLNVGETLIEVPYELMITFTTLQTLLPEIILASSNRLEMHELLSLFIIVERHKGASSHWQPYIDSLPTTSPQLPWLSTYEEIATLPLNLQTVLIKRRNIFEISWKRLKRSINSRWKCECCQIPGDRVITFNSFTWAYVMVNTRAVYIDPIIVRELSSTDSLEILSDKPCMALCPYLDMFNHSNTVKNDTTLVKTDGQWVYKLITLSGSTKYNEVFISYGSHDNFKLLCEYGFFIPDSELDVIMFNFNDVLKVTQLELNERQYKFIKTRKFDESLYIDKNVASFNLKALFFVMLYPFITNWSSHIFNEYSSDDLIRMEMKLKELLNWKLSTVERLVTQISPETTSEYFRNILNYLNYLLRVIKKLLLSYQ